MAFVPTRVRLPLTGRPSIADLSRRSAIAGLGASALAFIAFGPRGAKEAPAGKIVLDYWEKWTGHEADAMKRVVREFNNAQNKILVRYLTMNGIDQKSMVAIAAGDPPDVLGLWNYNVPAFAETSAILPIDELAAPKGVTLDTYALALRPILTHPDASGRTRMWATINTGGTLCLYYNKRIFREEGIPAPPRNLSELIDIHRRLTRRGPDGRLERAGFLHAEPGWWTWIWGYHTGGSMWDAASESATVASPAFARAYEWMQDANRDLTIPALQTFQDSFGTYDSPQNAFLSGKVAMVCQGPWLSNVIKEYNPALEYGAAPFPVADELFNDAQPVGLVDTDILVIPKGVKNPEASMEFVAYTQRPEVVEFLSLRHHKIYPLVNPPESFYREHPNAGIAAHQAVAASPRGFLCPRTRTWPQLKAEFDAAHNTIRRLEAPAGDILARVQARMSGILERNADQRQRRGGPPRGQMPVASSQEFNSKDSKTSKGRAHAPPEPWSPSSPSSSPS